MKPKSAPKKIFFKNDPLLWGFGVCIIIWIILFRDFLSGHIDFRHDAQAYVEHSAYLFKNLARGIFPLWNPQWSNGFPNDFFLQRLSPANPVYLYPILLIKFGVSFQFAYPLFLAFYHFLGCFGFFCLSKRVLQNSRYAFLGFVFLYFSCFSTNLSSTFAHLLFVPQVWFFYFLICLCQKPSVKSLLGITLTLMIILTTYVPFYFLTVLLFFIIFQVILFPKQTFHHLIRLLNYIKTKWIISLLCFVLIFACIVPGYLIFKEGSTGAFVIPTRHYASNEHNTTTVDKDVVSKIGALHNLHVDRQFHAFKRFRIQIYFLPILAYVLLFITVANPVKKTSLFLFLWGFSILCVSSPDILPSLYSFLYDYVVLFKFFRMLDLFLWFAATPIFVLFILFQLKQLIEYIQTQEQKKWIIFSIITVMHLLFLILLIAKHCDIATAYITLFASYIFFYTLILKGKTVSLWVLVIIAMIQPIDVFSLMRKNLALNPPQSNTEYAILPFQYTSAPTFGIYNTTYWYFRLLSEFEPEILSHYLKTKFIVYDNVLFEPITSSRYPPLTNALLGNTAYIHYPTVVNLNDQLIHVEAPRQEISEPKSYFEVLDYNFNRIRIKIHFPRPRFVVYNENFHLNIRAFLNKKPTSVYLANGAFQGFIIPSGEQILEIKKYSEWKLYFYWTLWLSSLFLCGTLLLLHSKKIKPEST